MVPERPGMNLQILRILVLRIVWEGFLLFTSIYCLLAFLPFTDTALIKAPPYDWLPWFVHRHAELYWVAIAASVLAYWPVHKSKAKLFLFGFQAAVGVWMLAHPVLPFVKPDSPTYFWSVLPLVLVISIPALEAQRYLATKRTAKKTDFLPDYLPAIIVGILVALLWIAAARLRLYSESHTPILTVPFLEIGGWDVLSHVILAILLLSVLNLIFVISARTPWPKITQPTLTGFFVFGILWFMLQRFLQNALSFGGLLAQLYAGSFARRGFDFIWIQSGPPLPANPSGSSGGAPTPSSETGPDCRCACACHPHGCFALRHSGG